MPDLAGQLSVLPLKDLVTRLAQRRASGELQVEYGNVQKRVFLKNGLVVQANSNQAREYLGQFLMNLGLLTEEQFVRAYATQRETQVPLGKVVVREGLVSEETLRNTLQVKFRETILDAFGWDDGTFSYDGSVSPPSIAGPWASVALMEIVQEGEYRESVWPAIRDVFPHGDCRLRVNEGRLPEQLPPESLDARLLQLAREGLSLDEMSLTLHASDYFLYPRLYALHLLGAVSLVQAGPTPVLTSSTWKGGAERVAEDQLARLRAQLLDVPRLPALRIHSGEARVAAKSPAERYLLSRMDGTRVLSAILDAAPLAELEGLVLVEELLRRGVITLAPVV